jgi:hypothetical protein
MLQKYYTSVGWKTIFLLVFLGMFASLRATRILIPMDESQKNHLKSYGIAFWILDKQKSEVLWLLNYRGGSFMTNYNADAERECKTRGVTFEVISESEANSIETTISNPEVNMNMLKLLNAPKIAVYSPKSKQPWDDAVTLVLTYAEIPYTVIFDDEVLGGVFNEIFGKKKGDK